MTDNSLYENILSLINKAFPKDIFLSKASENSYFHQVLNENFPEAKVKFIPAAHFDEKNGSQLYRETQNYKETFVFENNYLAFKALSAINSLFSSEGNQLCLQNIEVELVSQERFTTIECKLLKDLSVVCDENKSKSLFGLFKCRTLGGSRLLRSLLTQPFKDQKVIEENRKFVQFLIQDQSLFKLLKNELPKFKTYDNITIKFLETFNVENESSALRFMNLLADIKFFMQYYRDLGDKVSRWADESVLPSHLSFLKNSSF